MSRLILNDDIDPSTSEVYGEGTIFLDDDVDVRAGITVSPRMTIYGRKIKGRDGDGTRFYGWDVLAEDVPVIAYARRNEVLDGVTLLKVQITALYQGVELDETMGIQLETGVVGDPINYELFRVTSAIQSEVRLEVQAERVLGAV